MKAVLLVSTVASASSLRMRKKTVKPIDCQDYHNPGLTGGMPMSAYVKLTSLGKMKVNHGDEMMFDGWSCISGDWYVCDWCQLICCKVQVVCDLTDCLGQ